MKKEIFEMFAAKGIYLPSYQLDKLVEELNERKKKESWFSLIYEIENRRELTVYTDIDKGAFVMENKHDDHVARVSKKIIQMDLDLNVIAEHASIYQAALAIGKTKGCAGSISNCLHGKQKNAFGFMWRFNDKNIA